MFAGIPDHGAAPDAVYSHQMLQGLALSVALGNFTAAGGRHLVRPSRIQSAGFSCRAGCSAAFPAHLKFILRDRHHDVRHQSAGAGAGIDAVAQAANRDARLGQLRDGGRDLGCAAAEPVDRGDDQDSAVAAVE